jgi:hypothetical protein
MNRGDACKGEEYVQDPKHLFKYKAKDLGVL